MTSYVFGGKPQQNQQSNDQDSPLLREDGLAYLSVLHYRTGHKKHNEMCVYFRMRINLFEGILAQ